MTTLNNFKSTVGENDNLSGFEEVSKKHGGYFSDGIPRITICKGGRLLALNVELRNKIDLTEYPLCVLYIDEVNKQIALRFKRENNLIGINPKSLRTVTKKGFVSISNLKQFGITEEKRKEVRIGMVANDPTIFFDYTTIT